jgi:hypothetical protein
MALTDVTSRTFPPESSVDSRIGYDTATASDPATLEYVAVTIAVPAATPVTTPDVETVTAGVSEVLHVARLVRSIVVPSDSVAVAV